MRTYLIWWSSALCTALALELYSWVRQRLLTWQCQSGLVEPAGGMKPGLCGPRVLTIYTQPSNPLAGVHVIKSHFVLHIWGALVFGWIFLGSSLLPLFILQLRCNGIPSSFLNVGCKCSLCQAAGPVPSVLWPCPGDGSALIWLLRLFHEQVLVGYAGDACVALKVNILKLLRRKPSTTWSSCVQAAVSHRKVCLPFCVLKYNAGNSFAFWPIRCFKICLFSLFIEIEIL